MNKNEKAALRGTFFIENLGCAKNQVDAESIAASLVSDNWIKTDAAETADMIIVNTCGFVEAARRESIDVTLSFRQQFPGKRILLAGCLSERDGSELSELLPEIDGVFGNRAPTLINKIAGDVLAGKRPVLLPRQYESKPQGAPGMSPQGSAYLKIAEGCDNRCSFCSIPLIRGGLRSRPLPMVVDDAARLIESGCVEINIIAQDLGSYGNDTGGPALAQLLRKILEIKGHYWLRMLYVHPDRFPFEVLDLCRDDPRLLPYFDLPVQHGSKRILSKMGRAGDAASYTALIERIRLSLGDAVIRTTFLLGYPGEAARDFDRLKAFQVAAAFDWLGVFAFSREPGTRAYTAGRFSGLLKKPVTRRRIAEVQRVQQGITEQRMMRFVGQELEVLIEERVQGEELHLGRVFAQAPEVDGLTVIHGEDLNPGTFVRCRITKANGIDLEAVPV